MADYSNIASEDEIIEAVERNEPAATQEIADELEMTRQGADYRLRLLAEEGRVSKKMVGNSLVWTVGSSDD